jgi:hypothetical protein
MKLCLAAYNNRIASVFDNANPLKLFVSTAEGLFPAGEIWIPQNGAAVRISTMKALAVNVLICGAINHTTKSLLRETGITVMDWYCGDVQEVLAAWRNDSLSAVSIFDDREADG